jgi:Integrase core domain
VGIEEILTAARRPWQNPYAERLIGSIRRQCLNHLVILSARHLKRILREYFDYYNRSRTHLALAKDSPTTRRVMLNGDILANDNDSRWFFQCEHLIRADIFETLNRAARPRDLEEPHCGVLTEPEVQALVACRDIAASGADEPELFAD